MKNVLKRYPEETTDQLIASLLRRQPQFVKSLKDTQYIVDLHFAIKEHLHDDLYTWYRFQRRQYRRANIPMTALPGSQDIPLTRKQYAETRLWPSQAERYHAIIVGMLVCLSDIFGSVCTLYDASGHYHYCGEPHEVSTRISTLPSRNCIRQRRCLTGTNCRMTRRYCMRILLTIALICTRFLCFSLSSSRPKAMIGSTVRIF